MEQNALRLLFAIVPSFLAIYRADRTSGGISALGRELNVEVRDRVLHFAERLAPHPDSRSAVRRLRLLSLLLSTKRGL
jgi:hypothetical protein